MTAPRDRREDGQIAILLLGLCVLALTVVIGVVNVTALQLARVRLYDAVDAAALDAADSVDPSAVYAGRLTRDLPLSSSEVGLVARRYLAATDLPANVTAWRIDDPTDSPDGASARVTLTATVSYPLGNAILASLFGPTQLTVTSTATGHVEPVP